MVLMHTPPPVVTLSWDVLGLPSPPPSWTQALLDTSPWAWRQHHFHPPGLH